MAETVIEIAAAVARGDVSPQRARRRGAWRASTTGTARSTASSPSMPTAPAREADRARSAARGRRDRRRARRRADRREGSRGRRGVRHDVRRSRAPRPSARGARLGGGRAAARRRRDRGRQDQHARLRLPRRDRQPRVRADAQSVGADRTSGGSSGGSAAAVAAGLVELVHRIRRRRIDPHPVRGVRDPRLQAHATASCRTATPTRRRGARSRRAARWRARSPRSRTRSMSSPATPIATCCRSISRARSPTRQRAATLAGVRIIWSPTLGHRDAGRGDGRRVRARARRCSRNTARASSRPSTRCSSEAPVRSWFPRAAAGSWRTAIARPDAVGRPVPPRRAVHRGATASRSPPRSSSKPSRARIAPTSIWPRSSSGPTCW